jgi:acetyl-CoA carboxylase carboxyl transferase subunit beta
LRGFAILDFRFQSQIEDRQSKMFARSFNKRKEIPDGIWIKCSECGEIIYNGELSRNLRICPRCDYYFPLEPAERIGLLADKGSFLRYNADNITARPDEKSCDRAIITGEATLSGHCLVIAAIDLNFANETIGLFVCEEIVRAVAQAADRRLPLLLVCTNSNGTQAQNGIFCPAQTLSTSAAMSRLAREKLLYISVLAYSNSHGHFPGFAYIADVVIAESNIPGTSRAANRARQSGVTHAAQASFQDGMVDMIVFRGELKHTLADILNFFC